MSDEQQNVGLFIAYASLMTMAVVPIYSGSIASLSGMKRPPNAPKRRKTGSPLEDSDDEDEAVSESLSSNDAWMFPVMGSIVLFSLYLLFRFLDKDYINYLITIYFSVMGCAAVAKTGLMLVKKAVPVSFLKDRFAKYRLTLSRGGKRRLGEARISPSIMLIQCSRCFTRQLHLHPLLSPGGCRSTHGILQRHKELDRVQHLWLSVLHQCDPTLVSGLIQDWYHSTRRTFLLRHLLGFWNRGHGQCRQEFRWTHQGDLAEGHCELFAGQYPQGTRLYNAWLG